MIDFKLPFSATDQARAPAGGLAPMLARDMALMFNQIGVVSLRASVVDMESMAFQSTWHITERGEVGEESRGDAGLDSSFPAAMATIAQMGVAPPEQTVVRKLNPRHWAFAWRIDERMVAVAEARYRDQRDMQSAADTALVRLICDTSIRAGQGDSGAGRGRAILAEDGGDHPHLAWPDIDSRQIGHAPLGTRLGVLLLVISALVALWMAVLVLPRARDETVVLQTEVARLQDMSHKSMLNSLANTLATGDYGEVQAALSSFAALGYFRGAVVTNARQRVVAIAGDAGDARIGDAVSPGLAKSAQLTDLTVGSDRQGQLLSLGAGVAVGPLVSGSRIMQISAIVLCLTSFGAVVLLVLRGRRRVRA